MAINGSIAGSVVDSLWCLRRYLFFPARLDPELVRRARDRWWEMNPAPDIVKKDDPTTWLGGWENVDPERLAAHRDSLPEHEINAREGKHESASANGLSWTCRHVGGDEVFLDMLARPCFAAAEQLCGEGTLIYPEGKTQPGANFAHPGANFRGVGSQGQAGRGVCECSNGPLWSLAVAATLTKV